MRASGIVQAILPRRRVRIVLVNGHRLVAWDRSVTCRALSLGTAVSLEVFPCNMARARVRYSEKNIT